MKRNIIYTLLLMVAVSILIGSCTKTKYSFGPIKTPTDISIAPTIIGATTASPTGDGSGKVRITLTGKNAISYKVLWGDGDSSLTSLDTVSHIYTTLDTNLYTITVNAIGTGGATSTLSKQIKVLYEFPIPADVMTAFTSGSTKTWVPYADTVANFGVGPASDYTPDYYAAQPNEKPACAYAGVITFTKTGASSISINVDNNGQSFLIAAATAFYGQSGGDGCYVVTTGGTLPISFSGANTGGGNSPGFQFKVPGNGLVGFGTGGTTYQVTFLSNHTMILRDIGSDGNAWYQILKAQ